MHPIEPLENNGWSIKPVFGKRLENYEWIKNLVTVFSNKGVHSRWVEIIGDFLLWGC